LAHAAVEERVDVFQRLLGDTEVPVRMGAAFLLATMIDRRADAAGALLEAIDYEADEHCRGAFPLALMILAQRSPDDPLAQAAVRRFEAVLGEEASGHAARLGAGIALLGMQKQDAIPRALALARQCLASDCP
jgi:hypothetical protein